MVPVLAVRGFAATYLLSTEQQAAAEQRGSLANAAGEYGVKLRIPTEAELAVWGVIVGPSPPRKRQPSPTKRWSPARSSFRRPCRAGSDRGECAGTTPTTPGELAA